MSDDLFDNLGGWNELAKKVEEAPFPSAIFVHEAVPGLKRQWTSDGRLVLWINPSVIDRLPRMAIKQMPYDSTELSPLLTGIPVYEQ